MHHLIIWVAAVMAAILTYGILATKPRPLVIPKQEPEKLLMIPASVLPPGPSKAPEKILTKHLVVFRGLKGALEEVEVRKWAKANEYAIKIFKHDEIEAAETYVSKLKGKHVELLGYSKGAESVYSLARDTPSITYKRMLTVGTYHTVTTSFSNGRRPPLRNVERHWNFVEKHQQPKGFKQINKQNISLGVVSHYKAVAKTLELIDRNPRYRR